MKLKTKSKILISTLITLTIGGALIASFTFAWLSLNVKVDSIKLVAGSAEARVDGYMFKRGYDVDEANQITPVVNATPNITASPVSSSQDGLIFTFDDTNGEMYPTWDLMDLSFDEVSMNALEIPSYYLELQVFTIVEESYIALSLWLESFSGSTPEFTNFSYRYHVVSNNLSDPIDYATPVSIDALASKPYVELYDGYNASTGILLKDNGNSYFALGVTSQNIDFYEANFYMSVIIEVSIDPLTFYNYLKETANIVNKQTTFGLRLVTEFEYSLVPFGD